jgi:hypothetical protein
VKLSGIVKFQIPISIARCRSARDLLTLVGLVGLLTGCGKVGPPLPPQRIAERTSDLQAVQRGSSILLSWPGPSLSQKESSIKYVDQAEIYRLEEQRDQEPVLDREDYRNSAHPVGILSRKDIETQLKTDGFLHYRDNLDLGGSTSVASVRLRYAVKYLNSRGQEAPFSNTVAIEPVAQVSLPPEHLKVKNEAQDRVRLDWAPPAGNINGSKPAGVVGYNVYRRRAKGDGQPELLNPEPLGDPSFTDTKFKYAVPYIYTVRALSQGSTGLIESADCNAPPFTPEDKFKPSAPDPVSIASANSVISLFWPTSPEHDVVGYIIYRSESQEAKPQDWTRLTPEPISTVTYRDERVRLGTRYYYRVTAIDGFKNESESSTIVSEVANP